MIAKNTKNPRRVRTIMLIDLLYGGMVFIVLIVVLQFVASSRTFQLYGGLYNRVQTDQKVVALTFDDGPTPGPTDAVLRELARHNVKATFFLIGNEVERHPDEARKIIAAGHELGNHTYSHVPMVFLTKQRIEKEITYTDQLFYSLGYNKPTHVRPPYGYKLLALPAYLHDTHRLTITRDIAPDEHDSVSKDPEAMARMVSDEVRPGSIILLHPMADHSQPSIEAVGPIVTSLKDQGYKFVTVSELLQYR